MNETTQIGQETVPAVKHSKLSMTLNPYFHHIDRGGKLSKEVASGFTMMILSVCGIFINMQLIAKLSISGTYATANAAEITENGLVYAEIYFVTMMLAFVGSMLIGIVAKLPLVQVTSIGFSSVLISIIGMGSGLSYYNILVINFMGGVIYLILMGQKQLRIWILGAIPRPVRRALPASIGALLAFVSLQLTGLLTVKESIITNYGIGETIEKANSYIVMPNLLNVGAFSYETDKYHPLFQICFAMVILTFILHLIFKRYSEKPYLYTLLSSLSIFLIVTILFISVNWKNMKMSYDALWGRIWMIGSEDAMHTHITEVLERIQFGKIFSEGLDFSVFVENGGNLTKVIILIVLTFLFMTIYDGESTLDVVAKKSKAFEKDDDNTHKVLLVNSIMNVISPLVGGSPISVGKESIAGVEDGGKSGIAAIVASLGFLLSMFTWLIPAFFVTATSHEIVFNLYGHHGVVLQLLSESSFGITNAVMVIVGVAMMKNSLEEGMTEVMDFFPFISTLLGSLILSSIAYGVALGTITYVLIGYMNKRESDVIVTKSNLIFSVLSLVLMLSVLV